MFLSCSLHPVDAHKFHILHWLHLFSEVICLTISSLSGSDEKGGKTNVPHPAGSDRGGGGSSGHCSDTLQSLLTLYPSALFSQCKHPSASPTPLGICFDVVPPITQKNVPGLFLLSDRHALCTHELESYVFVHLSTTINRKMRVE